jgi:hypothetical protein
MRKSKKSLHLNEEEQKELKVISSNRVRSHREVLRATILLKYSEGHTITSIAHDMHTNRPLVERCINKATVYGALTVLKDLPGRGVKPTITDDAKSWVLSIACQSPKEMGYSSETWTYSLLKKYIRTHCKVSGYEMLEKINSGVLNGILSKGNIKPYKISYYLERRNEVFEEKMATVLQVYKEISLINENKKQSPMMTTLSYDEKPGIQAINNIAPQLQLVSGKYQTT